MVLEGWDRIYWVGRSEAILEDSVASGAWREEWGKHVGTTESDGWGYEYGFMIEVSTIILLVE